MGTPVVTCPGKKSSILSRKESEWENLISVEAISVVRVLRRKNVGCTWFPVIKPSVQSSHKLLARSGKPFVDLREGAYSRTTRKEARRVQRGDMHRVTINTKHCPGKMVTLSGSLPESDLRSAKWGGAEEAMGPALEQTWSTILGTCQK